MHELLLSVPEDLQPLMLISFDICSKLENSPFDREASRVGPLLFSLGLEAAGSSTPFFELIIPRIPVAFSLELHMTDSHYTDFAVWRATHAAVG